MTFSLMRRDGDVVVVRERDGKVMGRHKDRVKALRQLRVLFSLTKASFGGDRSAAGRYAAEQRWKNHKKIEKPPSSPTKLTQSEFLEILGTSVTGTEVFSRIAERLGKRMKPRLADLSDKEINLYRGVQDVDRDAQTLLSGEIRPLEFATWGQGTYASPDKAEAAIYGTLIGLRLDDAAKIVVGEDAWADAAGKMGIKWVGDYKTGGYQSDKIDMKAMKERVLAGKQQGFSGADLYNFWHASQGYDAAFIQDDEMVMFNGEYLTVNRKDVGRAVSKQVFRDIIKASFGGDRSAAGRYAAEQRWKNHQKKEEDATGGGKKFTSEAKDKEFASKYGNERQFGDGDCFQAAANLLFDKFIGEPSARICHGVPLGRGEIEGIRFDHGWVEVEEEVGELPDGEKVYDTVVYDYSNGKERKMPAALYYHFGQISSADVKRFTAKEALAKMKGKGFYGPWD